MTGRGDVSRRTLLAAAALAVAALRPAVARSGTEAEAYAVVEAWAAAFNAGDVERIVALYAPDALMFGTGDTKLLAGADERRGYFAPAFGRKLRVDLGEHRDIAVADGAVAVSGLYTFWREADGKTLTFPSRYSFVLRRQDGAWTIVQHHSSPQPKPPQ